MTPTTSLISVLLGLVISLITGGLKKADVIAKLSPFAKQIVVFLVAALANYIRQKFSVEIPDTVQAWIVTTIVSALAALGFYNLYASNTKAPGTTSQNLE